MPEYKYKVLSDGSVLADNMALDMACSFAQFLFEKMVCRASAQGNNREMQRMY